MKIASVEVFKMTVPMRVKRRVTFHGGVMKVDEAKNVVVLIHSDNGITGVGSTSSQPLYLGMTQETIAEAAKYLAPLVIGENPCALERINNLMDWSLPGNEAAKCAIDLALHDLLGKAFDQPAYVLLGGKQRDDFITTISVNTDEPDVMAASAMECYDQGYRGLEVQLGVAAGSGFRKDVERLRMVRESVGWEVEIVADAHRNWNPKEAISALSSLEPFDIVVESPTSGGPVAMAEVRRETKVPIIADEDCHTVQHAVDIIRLQAADILCIKPIKAGGLTKARRIAVLAESFGLRCRVDGLPGESKLSNTASAHLVLTLRNPVGCGVAHFTRLGEDFVVEGGLSLAHGRVSLPDRPGLGVEVSGDALRRA